MALCMHELHTGTCVHDLKCACVDGHGRLCFHCGRAHPVHGSNLGMPTILWASHTWHTHNMTSPMPAHCHCSWSCNPSSRQQLPTPAQSLDPTHPTIDLLCEP